MNILQHSFKSKFLLFLILVISEYLLQSVLFDRIVVLLVFFYCLYLGSKEKYIVNPFYLFSLTPFSLLIYFSTGENYMTELKHETYLLAVINMIVFVFALNNRKDTKDTRKLIDIKSSLELVFHSVILFVISLTENLFPFISSILWIFSIPSIVCAIKSRKFIMIILVGLYFFISLQLNPSKLAVLLTLITIMVTLEKYYNTNVRTKRNLLLFLLSGILLMILSFKYANKDGNAYDSNEGLEYYAAQGVEWEASADLFMPYMYITTPWSSLQHVMETQKNNTYGLWLFKPILGYFQLDDYFKNQYFLESYSSFNTFTYLTCGYKDFGYWGSVLTSLLLGVYVNLVYIRFKNSNSPLDLSIYVCVSLAVVAMFFSNHFFMASYPFTIFIVMELYAFVIQLFKNSKIPKSINA